MKTCLFGTHYNYFMNEIEKSLDIDNKEWEIKTLGLVDKKDIQKEIVKILSQIGMRCFLLEFQILEQAGKLGNKNIKEKWNYYLGSVFTNNKYLDSVFEVYPELKRIYKNMIERQTDFVLEMLWRLEKDKVKIENKLLGGTTFEKIEKIQIGKGDLHCGGKSVMELQLNCGMTIFYKPHSMLNDTIFYDFINRIEGKKNDFCNIYRYLNCGLYGWAKKVKYQECNSERHLRNFYERIGIMAGISYILGSHDFHYQNLIAHKEYPVLVDLENMFQTDEEIFNIGECTYLKYSVLSNNLFPANMSTRMFCAVTGGNGGSGNYQVPMINVSDKKIGIVYGRPKMEIGFNLPKQEIDTRKYLKQIWKGYSCAYRYFKNISDAEIQSIFSEEITSRHLVHDTQLYYNILQASYHPSLMMKYGEREAFLKKICPKGMTREYEIEDMNAGDIPYFYRKTDSRSLFTSAGREIAGYFKETVSEAVIRRKHMLNQAERKLQCELIRLSVELSEMNGKMLENGSYFYNEVGEKKKEWFELAIIMAEKIKERAIWNESKTRVTWLTLKCSAKREENVAIDRIDYYLYEGLAGIVVFFRAMNLACGMYDKICSAAEETLFEYTESILDGRRKTISNYTGAYCGEGAIVYAYQILFVMTGKEKYLLYAVKHAEIVLEFANDDGACDILYGNAGAILVFCNMYELTKEDKYLTYAWKVERFLRRCLHTCDSGAFYIGHGMKEPCGGLAHGNSGFIMSYGRLLQYMKKEVEYEKILKSLLVYENIALKKRTTEGKESDWKTSHLPSWCHGDLGITLAYLDLRKNIGIEYDYAMSVVLERVNQIIREVDIRKSMCLCHGNVGNMLMMEQCISILGNKKWELIVEFKEKVRGLLSREEFAMEIEKMAWGMMGGYAGIGYGCLMMSEKKSWMKGVDILRVRVNEN